MEEELAESLRAALGGSYVPGLDALATTLAEVISGALSGEEAQGRLMSDPRPQFAAAALGGQTVQSGAATLQFGGDTSGPGGIGTLQQITISGGTVSGPVIGSLHVTLPVAHSLHLDPHITTMRRSFQSFIDQKTRDFVGRDFAFRAIQGHIDDPAFPSGYIQVIGEPGIGKSALLSKLVATRHHPHHFNIAAQHIRSTEAFLGNMCAQLIDAYQLPYRSLPARATQDSGALLELLEACAERIRPSPVVIVIDALDEAEEPPSPQANRLYLPPALPAGVFCVVSTRPQDDYRLSSKTLREFFIYHDDPENQKDLRSYIDHFLATHGERMGQRIAEWGTSAEEFVAALLQRSEGNFMYLVLVLEAIRDGDLTSTHVGGGIYKLPSGLRGYYRAHWRIVEEHDRRVFEARDRKVVCQLAAAYEPVSIAQLEGWTRLRRDEVQLVLGKWRPFLDKTESADGQVRFRIYHASFHDFLREEIGLTDAHRAVVDGARAKYRKPR